MPLPRPSHTQAGDHGGSGWKPGDGLGAGPPRRSTGCRAGRGRTERLSVPRKARLEDLPLKTGHCLTGRYLHWTKNQPTVSAGGTGSYRTQTRDHLLKVWPKWKAQQKILWAEVLKENGRRKSGSKTQDLLADGRCSQAVLDFRSSTDVGRPVPADAGSGLSEWERSEREEEPRMEAEELGVGDEPPLFLPTPSFMVSADED